MKRIRKSSAPRGSSGMIVTPHSGGEGKQFKGGYDASQRTIASPSGGTVIANALKQPGRHVPADPGWELTPPDHFAVNQGPSFRSGPGIPKVKTWRKK